MVEPAQQAGGGWFDRLIDALGVAAGALLCGLTVLICIDVAGRKPGLYTIPWSFDVAEYTLYVVTFLGAPWVLREGGHIAIDLFVSRLRSGARRGVWLATQLIGATVCLLLLYYACRVWWISFSESVLIHQTFVFPEWVLLSVAPPTFLILFAIFARALLRRRAASEWEREMDGL